MKKLMCLLVLLTLQTAFAIRPPISALPANFQRAKESRQNWLARTFKWKEVNKKNIFYRCYEADNVNDYIPSCVCFNPKLEGEKYFEFEYSSDMNEESVKFASLKACKRGLSNTAG